MSIEQGFHLNISRVIPKNIGKAFGPYYQGYCSIFLGDHLEAHILPVAQDIASRFPEPEFKHELMKWELRGYTKEL